MRFDGDWVGALDPRAIDRVTFGANSHSAFTRLS